MASADERVAPVVDLVIAIDTSASMKDEATELSQAAEAAIEAAQSTYPSDLRVSWFGIEGTWKDTKFERTLRQYLVETCKVEETALRGRKRGSVKGGGAQEDGARAIEDISVHFDWRQGAKRAAFYLSDEALEGGGNQVEQKDIAAANQAIKVANQAGVIVHTYFGRTRSRHKEALQQEFARVAQETGGIAFTENDTLNGFAAALEEIICATQTQAVSELETAVTAQTSGSVAVATAQGGEVTQQETSLDHLAQRLQRLQQDWQSARSEIRRLGVTSGFETPGQSSQLVSSSSHWGALVPGRQMGVISYARDAGQWEARYQEAQVAMREVQAMIERAQMAVEQANHAVSSQTQVTKEAAQTGQSAFRSWFNAIESALTQHEQTGLTAQGALAQAQAALAQVGAVREIAQAERDALWGRITELETLLVQREEAEAGAQAILTQAQAAKDAAEGDREGLLNRIRDLETSVRQSQQTAATNNASLAQALAAKEAAQVERASLRARVTELEAALAQRDVTAGAAQQELQRVDALRASVLAELGQWEARYESAQEELQALQLELQRAAAASMEQSSSVEVAQSALRDRIAQLEMMLRERDDRVAAGQQEVSRITESSGQWQVRYQQAQEELRALQLELERAQVQVRSQAEEVSALQAERARMMAQITELEETVTHRGVSVEAIQQELRRAEEVRESAMNDRLQWEARYLEALREVQTHLQHVQAEAAAGASTTVTRVVRTASMSDGGSEILRTSRSSSEVIETSETSEERTSE